MCPNILSEHSSALRVLMANIPFGLREWLSQEALSQQDIQIVGHIQGYVEILLAVKMGVDVVILSEADLHQTPGICTHLLAEFPELKILLVSPSGEKAVLYWLGQCQKELPLASPTAILAMLRQLDTLTQPI